MLGHLVFDPVNHAARRESDFLIVVDQEARNPDTCVYVKRNGQSPSKPRIPDGANRRSGVEEGSEEESD